MLTAAQSKGVGPLPTLTFAVVGRPSNLNCWSLVSFPCTDSVCGAMLRARNFGARLRLEPMRPLIRPFLRPYPIG